MGDQDDRGFQVRDRRRFTESGESRDESESGAAGDNAAARAPEPEVESSAARRTISEDLPPITFSAFLMSLSSQALMCLGELAETDEKQPPVDLSAARELIDILGMLKERTRGNLDPTEAGLLDGVLYDLRMRYVGKVRG
jgi:Domain of unknown function (DUF1844)